MPEYIWLADIPFLRFPSADNAADDIVKSAARRSFGRNVHLANAYTSVCAAKDPAFLSILQHAWRVLPDGRSVVLAGKLLRAMRLTQVPGPSLFEDVLDFGRGGGVRHFMLGTTPETLVRLRESLEKKFPGVLIVGQLAPPYRDDWDRMEVQDWIVQFEAVNADIVWIGLGTPKQDRVAGLLAQQSDRIFIAVGAAFDFSSGTKRRGPRILRRLGLEWLFRLLSEPKRLWRRYLLGLPEFAWVLLRAERRCRQR